MSEFMRIDWKNVKALTPADFEEIEDKIKELLHKEGFEADIYNSVTGNETTVRNEE